MHVPTRSLPPPSKKWCQDKRQFRVDCWAFHIRFFLPLRKKTNVISKESCLWKGKKFPRPFFLRRNVTWGRAPLQSQDHSENWRAALELDLTSYEVSVSFSVYFNRSWKRSFHPLSLSCTLEIILVVKKLVGCFEMYITFMLTMGWQVSSIKAGRDNRVRN